MDNWAEPYDLSHLPPKTSSVWEARYENDTEHHKRTTRWIDDVRGMAPIFERLRSRSHVNDWQWLLGYDVWDDPTLHGGGIHVTEPGGWLSTHLDYDVHPNVPRSRRALNLILFLNPVWEESWGGALVLCDPMGKVVQRIYPKPGRLAAFEVGDLSYHGVEKVTGPVERLTAAVYFLSVAGSHNTRQRALFLPNRSQT